MATLNTPEEIINDLMAGNVAVVPTDTLYGIVAVAKNKRAVEKIYKIKGRDDDKPCIVLITELDQLGDFGVTLTPAQRIFLQKHWSAPVSVILSVSTKKYTYLHRGKGSIAFRMIGKRSRNLYNILTHTGPLIAPSANPQGKEPATCVWGAKRYFGDTVSAYLCGGTRKGIASTIVDYTGQKPKIIRQGSIHIIFDKG